jgi:hypothetical protein
VWFTRDMNLPPCLLTGFFSLTVLGATLNAHELVVHEWGTFTSVAGSDGTMLAGLEVEEETLPRFVHAIGAFGPRVKGIERPVRGVTVKMETPVLYFYSNEPLTVRVDVGFNGGSISQ